MILRIDNISRENIGKMINKICTNRTAGVIHFRENNNICELLLDDDRTFLTGCTIYGYGILCFDYIFKMELISALADGKATSYCIVINDTVVEMADHVKVVNILRNYQDGSCNSNMMRFSCIFIDRNLL